MRRRVGISGMGLLSSAGTGLEQSAENFANGVCCLSPIADPRIAHLKARYAGLLQNFEPAAEQIPPGLSGCDKYVVMAFIAAREALGHAGIEPANYGPRMGLVFSTCSGPMLLIEQHYERLIQGDLRLAPGELFQKRYYSGAQLLAESLKIQGLTTTIVTACTASTGAIALAADLVRCDMLDVVLAGGADAFSTSTLAGFDGLKATSDGKCAPFSKPLGLNLGEAAAFVVLEPLDFIKKRQAVLHAEIAGSGMSNDAYHCSSPEPTGRGLALAMQRALADSGFEPSDISYINAHGTGTEANDKAETRAIRKVFDEHATRVPISSTKSMVGHCLGAAGALEVIASILCAHRGVLPSTVNFSVPREGCNLDYVPDVRRPWPMPRTFLSNNLAFGGHNTSLVIRIADVERSPEPDDRPTPEICLTGFGLVSAAGLGAAPLLQPAQEAQTFTRMKIDGLPEFEAGLVSDDVVSKFDRRLDLRGMDRSSRWAAVAARLAMRDAQLREDERTLRDVGLMLALSAGPSAAESEFLSSFLSHDRQVNQLLVFPYIVPSSVAGNVCRVLRITGYNLTLSSGPGAGLLCLGPALAALRSGQAQCLLVGAVDELSERILADSFSTGQIGSGKEAPGEGAAICVLETSEHVCARKGKSLAKIVGFSFASADPGGGNIPARLLQEVLEQANCRAAEIGAVSADSSLWPELLASYPDWRGKLLDSSALTGKMEGAQSLMNAAVAVLKGRAATGPVLAFTRSSRNGYAAVVAARET